MCFHYQMVLLVLHLYMVAKYHYEVDVKQHVFHVYFQHFPNDL
ncbi:unnamed protein product [Schistosoma curassoni]|uniref:Uncharacterized protein n=1 Tax=Schistosoma curassoni TaxID=6186 RepID=A0A183KB75_9TREM|nr:unnamed protein product [Schistosoma curassoni]